MATVIDYIFNVKGNFEGVVKTMTKATEDLTETVQKAKGGFTSFIDKLGRMSLATRAVQDVVGGIRDVSSAGVTLDANLHDLSAVAGVTGGKLKEIEGYARESAKAFGTDASVAVTGYKLLLSQLSPELGKYPAALKSMGECIQTTSKLMGGDGVSAAEVLTTAMNQYGVSLEDPTRASAEMARMMNVMAAAGKAGSAELPAIKMALQQCGMAAKAAGVSFEEANAAIQVLDKAGKKGAEGGVALRNALAIISSGRFTEKTAMEGLAAAGVDVAKLADKSLTLKQRLEMLRPIVNDSALVSKYFGRENSAAALALINGTDALGGFTEAVTGTRSAEEQAATVMESYAERQARVNQRIEDLKISLFQSTGDFTLWASAIGGALVPLAQMMPLIEGVGKSAKWMAGMTGTAVRGISALNRGIRVGELASAGFMKSMLQATVSVVRFATVGVLQGIKALGSLALSFVTGGAASAAFGATARTAFGAFKLSAVTACRSVGVAIKGIPIIGWIVAIVGALAGLAIHFWNTSATFRGVLKGIWAYVKVWGKAIGDLFGGLWKIIKGIFTFDGDSIKEGQKQISSAFSGVGKRAAQAYNDAYEEEMAKARKKEEEAKFKQDAPALIKQEEEKVRVSREAWKKATRKADKEKLEEAIRVSKERIRAIRKKAGMTDEYIDEDGMMYGDGGTAAPKKPGGVTGDTLETAGLGSGKEGGKISNVTVTVDKLIEKFEIHTTNMREDMGKVKEMVADALTGALNDVNLAVR